MNWETIKYIYYHVLILKDKIEYLGEDKYRLTSYHKDGQKYWSGEYKDRVPHGRHMSWFEKGTKSLEYEYKNGNGILIEERSIK